MALRVVSVGDCRRVIDLGRHDLLANEYKSQKEPSMLTIIDSKES